MAENEDTERLGLQNSLTKVTEKLNTRTSKIVFIITLVFDCSLLIVGILKVHECPLNDNIPILAIVIGTLGIIVGLVNFFRVKILNYFNVGNLQGVLYVAQIILFICGSYYVFKEYKPNYDPTAKQYCDKTLYLFEFSYLMIGDILFIGLISGFVCFLSCLCCVIFAANRKKAAQTDIEGQNDEIRANLTNSTEPES